MMSVTQLQPGDEEMFRRYEAVSAWFEEIVDLNTANEPSDVERIRAFLRPRRTTLVAAKSNGC